MARALVFAIAFVSIAAGTAAGQAVTPVQSFADLRPLVKTDQQVIVWQTDGRKVVGRIVSVSSDQLELRRPPRFIGRDRHEVYVERAVARIDARDSTLNGGLIGLGLGLLGSVVATITEDRNNDDSNSMAYAVWSPTIGVVAGTAIDGAINRRLFAAPSARRVTLRPLFRDKAGRVVGAMAMVRF